MTVIHGPTATYNEVARWDYQALLSVFNADKVPSKTYLARTRREFAALLEPDHEFGHAKVIQLLEVRMGRLDGPKSLIRQAELVRLSLVELFVSLISSSCLTDCEAQLRVARLFTDAGLILWDRILDFDVLIFAIRILFQYNATDADYTASTRIREDYRPSYSNQICPTSPNQ